MNPRANRTPNNRETLQEGAARTSVQVGILMREQRAKLSEYLRCRLPRRPFHSQLAAGACGQVPWGRPPRALTLSGNR